MANVFFKVEKVEDIRNEGSEVMAGAILEGDLLFGKVYYTDKTEERWIFYPGDTCTIVN